MQNPLSVADQLYMCRGYAAEQSGWNIVASYHDDGISGFTIFQRPGMRALLEAAERREFDVLLCESMSRISRSYEMGEIYAQFQFLGIRIITLVESGEINDLHVAVKGAMNAMHLKDHVIAVRRGQTGMTIHGKTNGVAYGYEVVKQVDAEGEPIRGLRRIKEDEAEIVRRIFREYAAGLSALAIARGLNRDGVPAPTGKMWRDATIRGNPARGSGILNNSLYVGKLVWNRVSYPRNPTTGQHAHRANPRDRWITAEAPELRIVDQDLWDAVRKQQKELEEKYSSKSAVIRAANKRANALNGTHRPRTLLSGLLVCGHCGGSYIRVGDDAYGCATHHKWDSCKNFRRITRTELESRVLAALRGPLLEPEVLAEATRGYAEEIQRLNRERTSSYNSAEKRLAGIRRALDELERSLDDDGYSRRLRRRFDDLERQEQELEATLASEPPSDIPVPSIDVFRDRIGRLSDALGKSERDDEAFTVIRDLIDHITITPELVRSTIGKIGKIELTLHGDLAKILDHCMGSSVSSLVTSVEGSPSLHRESHLTVIEI